MKRAVLDHVLGLVAASPLNEVLVLRGSMSLLAWLGADAREPGDVDWIVRPRQMVLPDELDRYPYVDRLADVRIAPEAAHGAVHDELFDAEDLDAGGFRPRLPPEGTRWLTAQEIIEDVPPHDALADLLHKHRRTPDGIELADVRIARETWWGDSYEPDHDTDDEYGPAPELVPESPGGVRLEVDWRAGRVDGTVQFDLAYDERLPAEPDGARVPRADGGPPTPTWVAGPAVALAWKLQWLATDQAKDGRSDGKDLYDAVRLAELGGVRLPSRLADRVRSRVPDAGLLGPDAIPGWRVDWSPDIHASAGPNPAPWLDRLATAVAASLPG